MHPPKRSWQILVLALAMIFLPGIDLRGQQEKAGRVEPRPDIYAKACTAAVTNSGITNSATNPPAAPGASATAVFNWFVTYKCNGNVGDTSACGICTHTSFAEDTDRCNTPPYDPLSVTDNNSSADCASTTTVSFTTTYNMPEIRYYNFQAWYTTTTGVCTSFDPETWTLIGSKTVQSYTSYGLAVPCGP